MQLMIAAAPPLRQMACGAQLPIANAAYRIENGVLCALPMPPALRGGAMLLTGAAGPFSPETAAGVVQECRRRRYGTVIVPFPAAELTEALAQPLHRSGIALWVHEKCAHTAPGARVLVCTALSGGDIENRLSACCRAFGPDRIVLDLQRLRMDFPLPCPTGCGTPLRQEELLSLIEELNGRKEINGILVQLPLPKHIDENAVIRAISPKKDVDGFHPESVGSLCIGRPGFVSCTPAGIIQLLKRSEIDIEGKHCVVIGRSNIVGKPMALLMLRENATVTICHSRTKNLKEICKEADILIVAIGKPKMIDASYVKDGATVIDVGIHRDANNKLCGDVDFASVEPVAGAITPVPGGVGPMTIAMLMNNCVEAAEREE